MIIFAIKAIFFVFVVIPFLIFGIIAVLYLIAIIIISPLLLWMKVDEFFDVRRNKARSGVELIEEAIRIVCQYDRASASLLQRRLSIGYAQAEKILSKLQKAGVVSTSVGSKPRDVLIRNADNFIHDNKDFLNKIGKEI